MQIKYKLLEKMKNLTSTEMNFLIYIAKIQNLKGKIYGVHHKDVCNHTGMCKQSFYTSMWGLEKKGLIVIERCSGIDYDITIQDNDFSYKEAWKEGYVNLHRKIFHQKRFLHLKAKEKYMLMYFLKITHENSSSYRIGIATFYAKFCKELHVTARVVRSYLHSLRAFFSVRVKDGKYFITYRSNVFRDSIPDRIESWYPKAFVSAIARRFKLRDVTQKQIEDTAYFFKQYKQIAQEQNLDIFQLIEEAVRRVALEEEKPKKRKLNPKYVHVKIREILF